MVEHTKTHKSGNSETLKRVDEVMVEHKKTHKSGNSVTHKRGNS